MEQRQTGQTVRKEAETASAGEYRRILDTLKIEALGFRLDEGLSILWTSSEFYQKRGYTEEDFNGRFKNLKLYFAEYPEDFECIRSALEHAVNSGRETAKVTVHMMQNGGGSFQAEFTATFAERGSGDTIECRAVCQKTCLPSGFSAEQRLLKKKAEYFHWMLDEYSGNAYVADMENYELLYLNRTSCETVGLPLEKVLGRKCYEVVQNRTAPCPFCNNASLSEDEFYEWDFHNPVFDRSYLLKDRIINWEGRRARLELSLDNLSSEYKLEKKERERDAILRTIPGGFARVDARDMRTILWYGGGFLPLIGYTKEEFENDLHFQCSYVHPDDIERAANVMRRSMETGEDTAVEGRIITRDGTIKILTMTYSYVSGEDSWDGIDSFYSVGIDMTKVREEQERQQKALEDACQAARVANSAKTNFLSSMSHDIRTPMNAIMGMTAIAKANSHSPDKINDCLDKIETSSHHLLGLINEVLDMSKIESGKINLLPEPVILCDMIQRIMDMCRPLAAEKHQQFDVCSRQIIHNHVLTDGDRLQQVLMNLLSNAIKYTPEGGKITLVIREQYSSYPRTRQYEFICTDNGIGISSDFRPHIFEPFSRANDPQISRLQGTGLGMAISENIIRMMNGTITVDSELGRGSTFTVSVPLELCMEEQNRGEVSSLSLRGSSGCLPAEDSGRKDGHRTGISGKHVLLVEDNEINREIAMELLQMQNIRVDAAENGRQALDVFEASDPGEYDAILMDIQMPVMNGYDAATAIRSMEKADARTIPIIALTANAFTTDAARARSVGMNDHVAKPIEIERLLEVLEKWMA